MKEFILTLLTILFGLINSGSQSIPDKALENISDNIPTIEASEANPEPHQSQNQNHEDNPESPTIIASNQPDITKTDAYNQKGGTGVTVAKVAVEKAPPLVECGEENDICGKEKDHKPTPTPIIVEVINPPIPLPIPSVVPCPSPPIYLLNTPSKASFHEIPICLD